MNYGRFLIWLAMVRTGGREGWSFGLIQKGSCYVLLFTACSSNPAGFLLLPLFVGPGIGCLCTQVSSLE